VVGAGAPTGGAVLVLNDVTRLRRLERVRRDFVANVSHEIKTPITTIAGFVETLLDGALDDKEETGRFLRIVRRHAERLESIVEDLLTLARLEQEGEAGSVATEETAVLEVLQAAVEACRFQAGQKGIALVVEGDARLRAPMNAPLIEQALVNLVDNAVKYSPERSTVTIAAEATPEETVLKVADHGTGIAAADLPRIFERFYRVDRARSRKLGGTGLGLSIVKHVASVHGGRATVESSPGEGSTFALHLPARPSSARAGTGAGAGQASSPTRETPT
jgi:two-component system phosphate regulon sensor histidine kinase PhoR